MIHRRQNEAFQSKARTIVVVAGRRWGKSELACMWMLRGSHGDRLAGQAGVSWWIAPTYDLTRPIWTKMRRIAPKGWITRTVGTEAAPDYFELGASRIVFRSADHPERLVAEGLRRVVIDECGIIKESVWNESVMPALMDFQAPAMLVGTPKGMNWFYRMYLRGKDPLDEDVESFGGPSRQNTWLEESEIQRLASEMPERLYHQEILAEFLSDGTGVFRGHRRCVAAPSNEPTTVIGVDLAKHVDFTVLVGLDREMRMTFLDRFREVSWPLQKERIITRAAQTGAKVVLDSTGIGDPILDDLVKAGVEVEGYKFTSPSKQQLVEGLSIAIEQRRLGLLDDPVMLNELDVFDFEIGRTGRVKYSAPEGCHDDCVMALGLAVYGADMGGYNIDILNS